MVSDIEIFRRKDPIEKEEFVEGGYKWMGMEFGFFYEEDKPIPEFYESVKDEELIRKLTNSMKTEANRAIDVEDFEKLLDENLKMRLGDIVILSEKENESMFIHYFMLTPEGWKLQVSFKIKKVGKISVTDYLYWHPSIMDEFEVEEY